MLSNRVGPPGPTMGVCSVLLQPPQTTGSPSQTVPFFSSRPHHRPHPPDVLAVPLAVPAHHTYHTARATLCTMSVEATIGHSTKYACKCLNVRINPSPPPSPHDPAEPDYTPIYVGDEGIVVVHTQLTLRIRSRAKEQLRGDSTVLARYTSLKCLICRITVYRVHQVITPDVDTSEGPVTPSEEWADRELLKSISGWIEVSKDCITGHDIAKASPLISRLFSVILPSDPPLESITAPEYPTHSSPTNSVTPIHHLPALPPLFLPPPFTPAHAVFRHISTIANEESMKLREDTEATLRKIVQEKVTELQAAEHKLKQETELLWINYKQNVAEVAPTVNGHRVNSISVKTHQSIPSRSGTVSPVAGPVNAFPTSVRIHEFVPSPSLPRRASGVTSPIHQSALSSSLATSSFQHPRAQAESYRRNGSSPPSYSTNSSRTSSRSSTTSALSPTTASSRTLVAPVDGVSSIREAHRRNMDQSLDIATSFKYQVDIEAEMAANRADRAEVEEIGRVTEDTVQVSSQPEQPAASGSNVPPRGRSPRTSKSAIKKPKTNGSSTSPSTKRSTSGEGDEARHTPTKGKRKVTFDVKPEVAIISPNGPSHRLDESRLEQEPVFDMEHERDDGDLISDPTSPTLSLPTTPTTESARAPIRHHRTRSANMAGLPSSLSTLRPASLPVPSAIRPPIPHDQPEDRPRSEMVRESVLQGDTKSRTVEEYRPVIEVDELPTDPREAEILKLVAANTPSHRSAWKKDSKAWQVFVARHDQKSKTTEDSIAEEEEDSTTESNSGRGGYYDSEDDTSGLEDDSLHKYKSELAHSLPIAITPLSEHKLKFGVPSFQPKTSLSERPGVLVPPLRKVSGEAIKRATYAERDRARSVDPGTLDFTADEDEDDDDLDDTDAAVEGGKGRLRALKILEKRSEVPAEGMWRSLA
ncbi:hypothetical protein BXZ70DRAFT_410512 [Cristinia sonorae]|uniref:Uncharacterized protein n=1 Tax=Cristinia sonorae TaxID=1940300 RepID=A0A8K0UVT9_9AGAR|nr:hypothetical protein BXZ70DRAFT_410512 [Cristinia sonorae]